VPRLIEINFLEIIPLTERNAKVTKKCGLLYKQGKRREKVFRCPDSEASLCVRATSILTKSSSTFKVRLITFKNCCLKYTVKNGSMLKS
jgi:hypothetical protein